MFREDAKPAPTFLHKNKKSVRGLGVALLFLLYSTTHLEADSCRKVIFLSPDYLANQHQLLPKFFRLKFYGSNKNKV